MLDDCWLIVFRRPPGGYTAQGNCCFSVRTWFRYIRDSRRRAMIQRLPRTGACDVIHRVSGIWVDVTVYWRHSKLWRPVVMYREPPVWSARTIYCDGCEVGLVGTSTLNLTTPSYDCIRRRDNADIGRCCSEQHTDRNRSIWNISNLVRPIRAIDSTKCLALNTGVGEGTLEHRVVARLSLTLYPTHSRVQGSRTYTALLYVTRRTNTRSGHVDHTQSIIVRRPWNDRRVCDPRP